MEKLFFISATISILFCACRYEAEPQYTDAEKKEINTLIRNNTDIDSLAVFIRKYEASGNLYGQIAAYKELGKRCRENADFEKAIAYHEKGLMLAIELCDTIEMTQAFNNIGTNFRRMGALMNASEYHYKALELAEQCKKDSYDAKKNRLVALNGIGNIQLTLGNNDEAETVFRKSLEGEKELRSELGQAINTANIGAIFERRGQYDSAYVYYQYSLEHNRLAKSDMGMSLCYNHFGRIDEIRNELDKALDNYRRAYDIMQNSCDRWHWLESCIALARVYLAQDNTEEALRYIGKAEKTAREINSLEHIGAVFHLQYLHHQKAGNHLKALENYIQSRVYADSVSSEKNLAYLQNLQLDYEKEKSFREITLIKQNHEMERRTKNIVLAASTLIILLAVAIIIFLWMTLRMRLRTQYAMRRVEKMRTDFFTNITHEFRTPLTVILGLTGQLKKNGIPQTENERYLQSIERQGQSLLELVNQLLDMSKLMSKAEPPQWHTGDITAYLRMTMESYREYAHVCRVNLLFTAETSNMEMDFVPEYIDKIMRNLLSNALKFTPKDGIINVKISQKQKNMLLQVEDTGNGIASVDLPHIFDAFYQGGNEQTQSGTGIGLPYVQELVKSMGGSITADNRKNGGAVFSVLLPLKQNEPVTKQWIPQIIEKKKITLPVCGDMPKDDEDINSEQNLPVVLIVEDNSDISYYIGLLLKEKYHLIFASNGKEGLEKAVEYIPDLIVTDLMMPGMDGFEMCRQIRLSDILNHIPIVVITAKCREEDRLEGFDAGADAYLPKPFNADELTLRVAKLLEQRRLLREKFSQALISDTQPAEELTPHEQEFLNRLTNCIYAHVDNNSLTSNMIADKMCLSLSQLNRKLKTITGFNSSGFIMHIRMEKAKRLLNSTEKPIGDIAVECGFDDAGYFTRVFKQVFKATPSQYRKRPISNSIGNL